MRKIPFAQGEYYHLYNRGTNKMTIFKDEKDYARFHKLLYLCNGKESPKYSDAETSPGRAWTVERGESLVDIGAYCLMPNHFHILVRIKNEKDASQFLLKLLTSYSTYFNKKYDRSGSLFQGKTKSQHVENDNYLKYLYAYIHLNPLKIIEPRWKEAGLKNISGAKEYLKKFNFSSYVDYLNLERSEKKILEKSPFPDYFQNTDEVKAEIENWLTYDEKI